LKKEIDVRKADAITLANALVYTSPSYDNTSQAKKQRMWTSFMNSLDWNKITKKPEKPDPDALIHVFGKMGVPATKGVKK